MSAISQAETGTGTITPQVVTGEPVTVAITRPDKVVDTVAATANADGTYSASYTATLVGAYSGVASVVDQDTGTVKLLAASSPSASFNVAEGQVPRAITLTFSP